ncbi:molybdopterin-dependent oxidoreductase, partial [Rhizobium sp. TRM95111]|uniref:molybdopterin cofactor-binding domain-containing protein n=1 Tax=Rhizobium alarense TaxID=2846851 RepID=UPI001F3B58B9
MTAPVLPKSLMDNPGIGRWISFEPPGTVVVRSGKVELGQGILTALAQIVAGELGVSLASIATRDADTDLSPD